MSKKSERVIPITFSPDDERLNVDVGLALRAAVRAVLPGRQQQKNLAASLELARRAFYRTLLRRQRARLKA